MKENLFLTLSTKTKQVKTNSQKPVLLNMKSECYVAWNSEKANILLDLRLFPQRLGDKIRIAHLEVLLEVRIRQVFL